MLVFVSYGRSQKSQPNKFGYDCYVGPLTIPGIIASQLGIVLFGQTFIRTKFDHGLSVARPVADDGNFLLAAAAVNIRAKASSHGQTEGC